MFRFINRVDKLILTTVKRFECWPFRALALVCSDEGLTFETSALESLYGGQITFSTLLRPNILGQLFKQSLT